MLVGEGLDEDGDEVCGVVVNMRTKGDRLSVWTRQHHNEAAVLRIGRRLKEALGIRADITIGYQSHDDAQTKMSSKVKTCFHV